MTLIGSNEKSTFGFQIIYTCNHITNRTPRTYEMNKYREEGNKSFHENKNRYINPYDLGSNQFNNFERGYFQALKQCPDQLFKRYEKERKISNLH